jgi:hypothetical protein
MPGSLSGHWGKIAVAAALVTASGGTAVAAASPAAAYSYCRSLYGYNFYTSPREIVAFYEIACPSGTNNEPDSISKLVDGTWKVVASGSGSVTYVCQGSAENEYETSTNAPFQEPCG